MCGMNLLCHVLSGCDMFGVYVLPRHCGRLKCGVSVVGVWSVLGV